MSLMKLKSNKEESLKISIFKFTEYHEKSAYIIPGEVHIQRNQNGLSSDPKSGEDRLSKTIETEL